jgi:hypothetical protein
VRRPSPSLALFVAVTAASLALGAGNARADEAQNAAPTAPAMPEPSAAPPPASAPAAATPAPLAPTPLGRPLINLSKPEPPPPEPLRMHRHDGFYFRGDVGLLVARTFVKTSHSPPPSYSVGDGGLGLNLAFGGTPSPGMAVGGELSLASIQGGDSTAGLGMIGAFVDGFPDVNGGLHLGGFLGFAGSRTTTNGGADLRGRGLGLGAWIGENWWVADEWSMGGLVRFTGAFDHDGSHDHGAGGYTLDSSTYGVAFLFSVLYH